nr:putative transposase [Neisseria meningitidis 98080]
MPLPQLAAQDDTLSELLELINCQLTEKGLKVEKASAAVVDATIIQTAGSTQRQAIEVDKKDKSAAKPHRVRIAMPVG